MSKRSPLTTLVTCCMQNESFSSMHTKPFRINQSPLNPLIFYLPFCAGQWLMSCIQPAL